MAAKLRSKGTAIAPEINSVYTAVPQVISINVDGEESETYDGRTLDGSAHSARPSTGYVTNPDITFECFWDSEDTTHLFLETSMRTPPAAGVNVKLTDTAGNAQNTIWNIQGIGISQAYTPNDGVKANVKLATSGTPA